MTEQKGKKPQGFACLSPERRREIAAKGGRSVAPENRAYSRDNDLARRAGLKGGLAHHSRPRGGPPAVEFVEVWKGNKIALARRMAVAGKSLIETREKLESELSIPAFRQKCKRHGIVFKSTRPK